jgi:hypothetical protein
MNFSKLKYSDQSSLNIYNTAGGAGWRAYLVKNPHGFSARLASACHLLQFGFDDDKRNNIDQASHIDSDIRKETSYIKNIPIVMAYNI